ncbi:SCO7613 C-terminal domain-containing membrane protein [Spirillospora sp. NPDC050679]
MARELWRVDVEILRLTRHRRGLLARLHAEPAPEAPFFVAPPVHEPMPLRAARDLSRFGVRNALLVLGGALLGIAALAFTVISWGSLGMGARALILVSLMAVLLGVAWPLVRRGLRATAETLAAVGLVLGALQFYAAHAGNLFGLRALDGAWYAVGASAVLAVAWTGYARIAPLRLPMPVAVVLGHAPPLLAVIALDVPPMALALVALAVSVTDLGLREVSTGAVRGVATFAGLGCGAVGAVAALVLLVTGPWASPALLLAGGVALLWGWRLDRVLGIAGGLLCSIAVADALPLSSGWEVAGLAGAALLVLAGTRLLPHALRGTAGAGAGAAFAVAVVWVLPGVLGGVLSPMGHGAADGLPGALPAAPVVLGMSAGALLLSLRVLAPPVVALAVVIELPHPGAGLPLAVALGIWAARDRAVLRSAAATAAAVACWTVLAVPADQAHFVLGATTVAAAVYCQLVRELRALTAAFLVVSLGGFAATLGTASMPLHLAAFGVVGAAAVGVGVAAWTRSVPAEAASGVVAVAGVAMTAGRPEFLSPALALVGGIAFAAALRSDRRQAGWAGTALLVAAWWVWLAQAGVTAPEVYSAPVSLVLLVVGLVRRSRRPSPSSWDAYGIALAATLLPSLAAAWTGDGPRPLLLAGGALAVTLAGARVRLQAPLLLGGGVLVLVAGHVLAPMVVEFLTGLPGWVPVAAVGLLVLGVGVTYEQRLRDLRRLRTAVTALD